ncbi:MAG: hypothetical protein GC160_12065 [Acidobacteria bacterium]|nr:hypothetical protein [Acidobacteriota bacterium]
MVETIITSIVTAAATSLITFLLQERKLRTELRTEFMAVAAVSALLKRADWQKRSFEEIRKRLGGFDDDQLRRLLVRAGAVRFVSPDGREFWGLMARNADDL